MERRKLTATQELQRIVALRYNPYFEEEAKKIRRNIQSLRMPIKLGIGSKTYYGNIKKLRIVYFSPKSPTPGQHGHQPRYQNL